MSAKNVQVVERFLGALSKRDVQTVLSCIAPDVVIDEAHGLPFSGRFVGVAGAIQLLEKVASNFTMDVTGFSTHDSGEFVTAKLAITYTANVTGRSVNVTVVELYTVVEGLINHIDVNYKDPGAVMALAAEV